MQGAVKAEPVHPSQLEDEQKGAPPLLLYACQIRCVFVLSSVLAQFVLFVCSLVLERVHKEISKV